MSSSPDYDIRFSELDDLSLLTEWFSAPGACDDYPCSEEEKGEFLKNWIGFSKFKAGLTGTIQNTPCAMASLYLMPYRKVAHHCSFYLMVDPAHRNKGIGTSMVRNLLHLAKTRFRLESVHVEMFEPSLLLPILKKLGFQFVFRQEHFMKMKEGHYRARIVWEHPF